MLRRRAERLGGDDCRAPRKDFSLPAGATPLEWGEGESRGGKYIYSPPGIPPPPGAAGRSEGAPSRCAKAVRGGRVRQTGGKDRAAIFLVNIAMFCTSFDFAPQIGRGAVEDVLLCKAVCQELN